MSLALQDLSVKLATSEGFFPILTDVSFRVLDGATLGVVGESGSGKSVLALAIMGLLPNGMIADGRILLDGQDLLALSETDLCHVRGARMGMVFQEPATALNPAMRVGDQIAEGLLWHRRIDRTAAKAEALRVLDRVRLPDARWRFACYPHELSGGQRQRVGIAIALAPGPRLLIADEPTTALDVTVQSEILDLLADLVDEMGMSLIMISHDLGVIAGLTERTLVLYAGTRFEEGPTESVLNHSLNPYTRGLLAALPKRAESGSGGQTERRARRLASIPGNLPQTRSLLPGCRFGDRCSMAISACRPLEPAWREIRPGHGARCIRAQELL